MKASDDERFLTVSPTAAPRNRSRTAASIIRSFSAPVGVNNDDPGEETKEDELAGQSSVQCASKEKRYRSDLHSAALHRRPRAASHAPDGKQPRLATEGCHIDEEGPGSGEQRNDGNPALETNPPGTRIELESVRFESQQDESFYFRKRTGHPKSPAILNESEIEQTSKDGTAAPSESHNDVQISRIDHMAPQSPFVENNTYSTSDEAAEAVPEPTDDFFGTTNNANEDMVVPAVSNDDTALISPGYGVAVETNIVHDGSLMHEKPDSNNEGEAEAVNSPRDVTHRSLRDALQTDKGHALQRGSSLSREEAPPLASSRSDSLKTIFDGPAVEPFGSIVIAQDGSGTADSPRIASPSDVGEGRLATQDQSPWDKMQVVTSESAWKTLADNDTWTSKTKVLSREDQTQEGTSQPKVAATEVQSPWSKDTSGHLALPVRASPNPSLEKNITAHSRPNLTQTLSQNPIILFVFQSS
ncbi:hypothetical protein SPI_07295 [Niveomyces insectorum RCEF 264]|uniref:Uncharacterized protein n=1 Tax=Niveomyces insectorum RCEF 264 TaxID=1081102 RepID=A0A167QH24_9HYPO|nr:hypothetical protein SPI_07295 [Niveomyces insectorum RCEF 264]